VGLSRVGRSIRARLTLGFFVITVAAIGGIYLYVVPRLESRLTQQHLDAMSANAVRYAPALKATVGSSLTAQEVARRVQRAAGATNARVALLRVGQAGGEPQPQVVTDSNRPATVHDLQFTAALEAAVTGRPARETETASTGRWAEAAVPFTLGGEVAEVAVFATPLDDVTATVSVVRRQILTAGAVALVLAVLAGALIARALSARLKRLERAAEAIAHGDFSRPIPVSSDDEVGQLAMAFNDMQRQLAQLETARKQFIATASHELRTPIFSLGGFVELLEDEELDDEERARFVAQLGEQVDRLRKLAVDLLDLSRLEAGSLELRPEPVDVAELTRGVAAEFEPALARHDSHLELRLGRGPTEATCDPVRVAQVLRILIDNALTHTPAGTDIVVAATREDGVMRLAVRDRGEGIRRGDVSRIFEPFFTSNGAQGSGLGLAIASELAERMDGALGVDSAPGRTTFTLEIPA
jgi:two-component system OmpR family sensor kinase